MIQKKMDYVVKKVLGDNHSVIVLNDHEYQILKDENVIVIQVSGTRLISSHWREIITNGINVILQEKIKSALSEI